MTLRCSPIVAVTSKKSHTKLGSLMLYRILHWLPVLPGSLTIVPSTIRIVRLIVFFEPIRDIFPKQFDTQETQPLLAVAQAFEQGDIRNVGPVRELSAHNRLPQRVTPRHMQHEYTQTARQSTENHAIARPPLTATPFAAILRETTTPAPSSFLWRYAFTKNGSTNTKTCSLS